MSVADLARREPRSEGERESIERDYAHSRSVPMMARYQRSRKFRRCDSRLAPWCKGIRAGDRYARYGIPPRTDPFDQDYWITVAECEDCAHYCGREIPATGSRPVRPN